MSTEDVEVHATHSCLDVHGNAMTAGEYLLTRVGHEPTPIEVSEDEVTGDLAFTVIVDGQAARQRVEECAADVTFVRVE